MLFWFVPAGACTRSDRGPVDRTGRYAAVRFGQAIGAREEAHRSRANARERPRPKRVGRLEPCFDRLRFVTSAFRGPVYPTTRNDGRCGRARDVARTDSAGKARRGAGMAYARTNTGGSAGTRGVRVRGRGRKHRYTGYGGGRVRATASERCPLRRDVRRHGDAILKRTIS